MKLVYSYKNYREFISDFLDSKKSSGRQLSARGLSASIGLASNNYMSLILDGKRKMTIDTGLKFAEFAGLNPLETKYFILLIQHNDATSENEKNFFKRSLLDAAQKKPLKGVKSSFDSLSTQWNLPIIMLIAIGKTKVEAISNIAQSLKISNLDSELLLRQLEEQKILHLNQVYEITASYITQRDHNSIKNNYSAFLFKHVDKLLNSVSKKYSSKSKYMVHILAGKSSRKAELFKLIDELTEESASLVENDPSEEIFVMHLHCVPLQEYL
jgi:uncharacterized protein (TIGR02147 family)